MSSSTCQEELGPGLSERRCPDAGPGSTEGLGGPSQRPGPAALTAATAEAAPPVPLSRHRADMQHNPPQGRTAAAALGQQLAQGPACAPTHAAVAAKGRMRQAGRSRLAKRWQGNSLGQCLPSPKPRLREQQLWPKERCREVLAMAQPCSMPALASCPRGTVCSCSTAFRRMRQDLGSQSLGDVGGLSFPQLLCRAECLQGLGGLSISRH